MRPDRVLWGWRLVWFLIIAAGVGVFGIYLRLPADGATGDMASFGPDGYTVQWLLEGREAGLQVGDIIVSADGHTWQEWLNGAFRSTEWRNGGTAVYDIRRDQKALALPITLTPIPITAILEHWAMQLLASLGLVAVGSFVFWRRPESQPARVLMLFCLSTAMQLWTDAFNIQYSVLPWRSVFGIHLLLEQSMFLMSYASVLHFALVFPTAHPLLIRHPALTYPILYGLPMLITAGAMLIPGTWAGAMSVGNETALYMALGLIALSVLSAVRSVRRARDPVSRAQIRWLLWAGCLGIVIAGVGYLLPFATTGRPWIPHPVVMIATLVMPSVVAIALLRYRLFEIDIIINRTLVYVTLTALLAGLYLALVRVLSAVLNGIFYREGNTLVVFLSTMVVALAFNPARQRVQAAIDRAFYRTKLDYQRLATAIGARLATRIVPDELGTLLTVEIPERLQIAWAQVDVLDQTGQSFVRMAPFDSSHRMPADDPLPEFLRNLGAPLSTLQPPRRVPDAILRFLGQNDAQMYLPLVVGSELVGVYSLGPKLSGNGYSSHETNLLNALAQQIAIAIQNSRLFRETERQASDLAMLHDAAIAVSSSLETRDVLGTLAERLGRSLNASWAYICRLDEGSDQSTVLAAWVPHGRIDEHDVPVAIQGLWRNAAVLSALMKGEPRTLRAAQLDAGDRTGMQAGSDGKGSYLFVPITSQEQVIGFAALGEERVARTFSRSEIRLGQTLAADAAAAIERATLFQSERQQRLLAEALQEAAAVVSSTLDLSDVLDRILIQVERVVAGDAFNVMLIEDQQARVVRFRGYEKLSSGGLAPHSFPLADFPSLERMIRTEKPMVVSDTEGYAGWVYLPDRAWLRSYVAAPVRIGGSVVGFLNVDGTRPGQFGPADAARLEAFAIEAAIAIQNAGLFEQVQQHAIELENRVAERTKELAEANERLKELDRLKSRFVSEVSHELRTPVTNMGLYLHLLERASGDKRDRYLDVLNEQTKRLARLIEDILDLSRLESGSSTSRHAAVNLSIIVEEVLIAHQARAEAAGLALAANLDPGLPLVYGDASQLAQLATNLIGNAIQYTLRGGIEVGAFYDSTRDQICLEVKDTGMGIASEDLPHVFDRFYRGQRASESGIPGTGLGLAIVKEIVELHRGTINVQSEPGEGATFRVWLPVLSG